MNLRVLLFLLFALFIFYCPANAQTFSSGNIHSWIADNQSYHFVELNVSGLPTASSGNFGLAKVCLDIDHPDVNELVINLISPDQTRALLDEFNLGSNYKSTCFTGTAPNMINEFGMAPFTGNFKAQGDLGKFNNGKNLNGKWLLRIQDVRGGNIGVLNNWSLTFSTKPAPPFRSSTLPIMVINTNGQWVTRSQRIMVDLGVIYKGYGVTNNINDPYNHYNGKASIRYRGQSSLDFPKKPYALDTKNEDGTDRDYPLLDMPSEHKWVLYASYNDKTLLRNVLSMHVFKTFGHYSVKTRFVELVIDGDYRGVYVLMEKIKRDRVRVPIKSMSPDDTYGNALTGGYIVSIDKHSDKRDGWYSKYGSNSNGNPVRFQYVYPKPDKIQPAQKNYIKSYIDAFEDVLIGPNFKDPDNGYRKYIHTWSFVDNFILNELSRDVDAYRISSYFYKDRDTTHHILKSRLINGPVWDFDLAWYNANFGGANQVEGWQYQYGWDASFHVPGEPIYPVPFWWRRLMEDPAFVDEVNCRYWTLRKKHINPEELNKLIDIWSSEIHEARIRNFKHWPLLGKWVYSNVTPVAQTYEDEIAQLKNWITRRIEWMDKNIPGSCKNLNIEEQSPMISNMDAFPNPFKNGFNLNYYVRNNAEISVDLVNAVGMHVRNIFKGNQSSGIQSTYIDGDGLPNGLYLVIIQVDDKIYQKKLIKNN
jgi:subtilisin-like proprotein convertase family protein